MDIGSADRKKSIYWFLITAILVTVAFRWPTTYHETGVDSFFIHNLANSAAQFGELRWVINPLSLFGLFPLSYASGVPILLAEFSNMSGLTMEICSLVFSFLVAIIAALTAFLLGMEIKNSPIFAFTISLLYSASPLLLVWTEWTITTRNLFMALLPLTLWILVRMNRVEQNSTNQLNKRGLMMLLLVNLLLLAFVHNLFLMILLFILAYYTSRRVFNILNRAKRITRIRVRFRLLRRTVTMASITLVIILVAAVSYSLGWLGLDSYEAGFFNGQSDIGRFLNLLSSISATIGYPIAFLFPIGMYVIVRNKKRGFLGMFFLISFLFILPFSGGRTYERLLYPCVLGVLILLPCYMITNKKLRKNYIRAVIVALILTMPVNLLLVDHYNRWSETQVVVNDGPATPDHAYMTALYFEYYYKGEHFTGNNWLIDGKVQAYSNSPMMLWDDTVLLIYGVIDSSGVNAELNSLSKFFDSGGEIYSTNLRETLYLDYAFLYLTRNNPTDAKDILDRYGISKFIEDGRLEDKVMGYNSAVLYPSGPTPAPFIIGVKETTFRLYYNGIESIWSVDRGF